MRACDDIYTGLARPLPPHAVELLPGGWFHLLPPSAQEPSPCDDGNPNDSDGAAVGGSSHDSGGPL